MMHGRPYVTIAKRMHAPHAYSPKLLILIGSKKSNNDVSGRQCMSTAFSPFEVMAVSSEHVLRDVKDYLDKRTKTVMNDR